MDGHTMRFIAGKVPEGEWMLKIITVYDVSQKTAVPASIPLDNI
jgi:hypothetical protein